MDIRTMWYGGLGFVVLLMGLSQPVRANPTPYQSLESIQSAAMTYAQKSLGSSQYQLLLEPAKMDPRLRLTQCDSDLVAFIPNQGAQSNKVNVSVSCDSPDAWTLYVPILVKKMAKVVTINQDVSRNQILSAHDLSIRSVDIATIGKGYYTDPQPLIGMLVKKSLRFGEVVTSHHVQLPTLVERGAPVKIITKIAGLTVTAEGMALRPGAKGDKIPVRNISSSRIIEAEVLADGTVEVPFARQ